MELLWNYLIVCAEFYLAVGGMLIYLAKYVGFILLCEFNGKPILIFVALDHFKHRKSF